MNGLKSGEELPVVQNRFLLFLNRFLGFSSLWFLIILWTSGLNGFLRFTNLLIRFRCGHRLVDLWFMYRLNSFKSFSKINKKNGLNIFK